MDIYLFDFDLPKELIAQSPSDKRSESRMLVMDGDQLSDRHFYNIGDYIDQGDVLVLNDTRVLAARLFGIKEETFAKVEVLILEIKDDVVKALVGNARVVKQGTVVSFGEGKLRAKCIEVGDEGIRIFELMYTGVFLEILDELGEMPLPPYIHETLKDKERYQTVYSKYNGSAAAPTAGLHFTDELLDELESKGVMIAYLTLHVGLGTFRPVKTDNILEHTMHAEEYRMSKETAAILNKAKQENRSICAVGTTCVRTLETVYQLHGRFKECHGQSEIFIYPGFEFKVVDEIITNFHLPKSTLIMLVSAFAGLHNTLNAYQHAIDNKYRFFSFGDSMFVKKKKVL